jgi:hypothetical protein
MISALQIFQPNLAEVNVYIAPISYELVTNILDFIYRYAKKVNFSLLKQCLPVCVSFLMLHGVFEYFINPRDGRTDTDS